VSSVALVPLAVWLLVALATLPAFDHHTVATWVGSGWTPVWLFLFVLTAAHHSQLGIRVIIEDYVHAPSLKTLMLLVVMFAHVLLAIAGAAAILKLAYGTPA
jgi:succinate dehydrogenase / fumarate reductase membrane anchor subunit